VSTASALDLTVDDAIVLQDANRVALRLMPCDVVARSRPWSIKRAQRSRLSLPDGSRKPIAAC